MYKVWMLVIFVFGLGLVAVWVSSIRSMPQLDLPPGIAAPSSEGPGQITCLVVGRQGYGNELARQIAQSMERLAAERPTHFVVLAGDNFYPEGVRSESE
ncbi:MAG: hypothetical protein JSW45_03065 [Thiotrichales bacterium]|nr:MAG: hypothetical protein JSW45_03065 [Thiotrichales bacterium]